MCVCVINYIHMFLKSNAFVAPPLREPYFVWGLMGIRGARLWEVKLMNNKITCNSVY